MDDTEIIVAMQQRNRANVHTVKGVQASIQNRAVLIKRDGMDAERMISQLDHWALILSNLAETMQSDVG